MIATITLNATAAQSARIVEAVAVYNTANGTSLTVKQWIYLKLEEDVISQLSGQINAAAQAVRTAIKADMAGGN